MKVKSVKRAPSTIPDLRLKGGKRRQPTIRSRAAWFASALTLSLALTLSAPALPQKAAAFEADKARKASEKLHKEGRKALRQGKHEKALEVYTSLLDANPQDVPAHLGIALAHIKLMDYSQCFDHANAALRLEPENARARALAGLALLRLGYVPNAVEELNKSIRLDPKEPLAFGAAAEIDYYEGRSKEARQKAYIAFTLDSNEPDYLLTFARASSRLEMYTDAADAYDQFLRVAPVSDKERRDRIRGLIQFYRELAGIEVHQISGADSTEVPFRLGRDRRPYLQLKLNGRDATFVVDTGSGFTVVSKSAAKRLGIKSIARGGSSQGVGGSGKFPIVYGLIKSLQFNDIKIKMIPCFIRPFHSTKDEQGEEQADGFVGLSVLAHFVAQLDYKDSLIRLDRDSERAMLVSGPDVKVIPFRTTQNGLISVETELDGNHRINAILDSGASSTVISTAAVDRLQMSDSIIQGQTVSVIGAAGIASNVKMLFIRNCKIAGLQQNNLRALILDFDAINETSGFEQSGIIGGDFLRHFRVTIDFSHTQVAFQPHTIAAEKE